MAKSQEGINSLPPLLRAGLFGEFCDSIALRYGGYEALKTGWVSNILFQPHIGAEVLDNMAARESLLTVKRHIRTEGVEKLDKGWKVLTDDGIYVCKVLIDCTELGDVANWLIVSLLLDGFYMMCE